MTGRNEATGEETVEVVHEALIKQWQSLRDWMKGDRTFRTWQEQLRAVMRQWENSGNDRGVLLRGFPLDEAKDWLERRLLPSRSKSIENAIVTKQGRKRSMNLSRSAEKFKSM